MNSQYYIMFHKFRLNQGQQIILLSYNIPLPGVTRQQALMTLGKLASTLKWNCQGESNPPEMYISPNGLQAVLLMEDTSVSSSSL